MPSCEVFCTIMSTLTARSASPRNNEAAMPGRSGTPVMVSFTSEVSLVTAETIGCSMDGSSSLTQVPGSQVKLERTWSGTWWLRANSTERSASTRPPVAAISSISSKEIRGSRCALGTNPGIGGEHARDVGVDLAAVGAEGGRERHGRRVRAAAAERRDVALRSRLPGSRRRPGRCRRRGHSRSRSPRTSRIFALVCVVSVMMPAWLPVNDAAGTPSSASAMHSSAIEIRSPAVSSMSSSRPGWTRLTSSASRMRSSVVLPIALTTTTTSSPARRGPGDVVGDGADPVGVADRGAAVLLDDDAHAGQATASQAPPRADGRPPPRFQ